MHIQQIITYLHAFMILQPLIYALQLYTYRGVLSKSHRLLAIYMLLISLYFAINAHFLFPEEWYKWFFPMVYPLLLSFNPFYYLYVRSLTDEQYQFKPKVFLHYIPAFVMAFISLLGYLFDLNVIGHFLEIIKPWMVLVYYLQVVVYVIAIIQLLKKHQKNILEYFSYTENISLSWLWVFLFMYIAFSVLDISLYFLSTHYPLFRLIYFLCMILFINFLGFFGIKQSDIYLQKLYEAQVNIKESLHETSSMPKDKTIVSSGFQLTEEFKQELYERILQIMKEKKLYVDPELNIITLAKLLETNYKYVSIVINEKTGNNFFNFINDLRVEEAIENMKRHGNTLTLEAIAQMSGFRNRSTFLHAFKKKMGVNPSEFMKSLIHVNQ